MKVTNTNQEYYNEDGKQTINNIERETILEKLFPRIIARKKKDPYDAEYLIFEFETYIRKADTDGQYYLYRVTRSDAGLVKKEEEYYNRFLFNFLGYCYINTVDFSFGGLKDFPEFFIKDLNTERESDRLYPLYQISVKLIDNRK
jgi:hypothetical protein